MDGDDVALPERLAAQVDALADSALAACGGRVSYFPEECETVPAATSAG